MEDNVNFKISEDVISTLAVKIITKVPGVHDMNGGIMSGINSMFAKKLPPQGIKVNIEDKDILMDVYITVEYGVKIPDIAWEIQDKVKKELESITGMHVAMVNVHIQGINFDTEHKENSKK